MKRWIVAAGAALATVTATALLAPAAQAGVDQPYIFGGRAGTGVCWIDGNVGQTEITVTGNPGDSFVFVNSQCGAATVLVPGSVVSGPTTIANGSRGTYTLGNTVGTGTMLVRTPFGNLGINIVVSAIPVTAPVVETHDTIQQVGVPASGDCADVRPSVGHYPGFPVGGWTKSWAYWINDGKGGPVCTRELDYDYGLSEWRYLGQQ